MKLKPSETLLKGEWKFFENSIRKDDVCERIELLINIHLKKICSNDSGWDVLYLDPEDDRLWVLTYPNSNLHAGGAPTLKHVTMAEAQKLFPNCLPENNMK